MSQNWYRTVWQNVAKTLLDPSRSVWHPVNSEHLMCTGAFAQQCTAMNLSLTWLTVLDCIPAYVRHEVSRILLSNWLLKRLQGSPCALLQSSRWQKMLKMYSLPKEALPERHFKLHILITHISSIQWSHRSAVLRCTVCCKTTLLELNLILIWYLILNLVFNLITWTPR